jgi:hypothetical protein
MACLRIEPRGRRGGLGFLDDDMVTPSAVEDAPIASKQQRTTLLFT